MVNTPVLFITFARPEYARKSWDAIRAARPKNLYFYSNKGRKEKEGELEKNEEIRSYVNEIDWDCNLHTWFRDETVDVYKSLRGAISWLFENEEQGIVLEEDCVASLAFFDYCEQLLSKYREDQRIWIISGDNYINYAPDNFDYLFSGHFQIYGWASWRDRWNKTNWNLQNVEQFPFSKEYKQYWGNNEILNYRKQRIIKKIDFLRKTKCWDEIFYISMEQQKALSVFPKCHLVTNIGITGSHHKKVQKKIWNIESKFFGVKYVLNKEPQIIERNTIYDDLFFDSVLKQTFFKVKLSSLHYYYVLFVNKFKQIFAKKSC